MIRNIEVKELSLSHCIYVFSLMGGVTETY